MIDKIRKEEIFKKALKGLCLMNIKEGFMSRLLEKHPEMYKAIIDLHNEIDKNYMDDNLGIKNFEKAVVRLERLMAVTISADNGGG